MKFAVVGAGKMGRAIVYDLARAEGATAVDVFDIDGKLAAGVARESGNGKSKGVQFDAQAAGKSGPNPLAGYDAVISAVTYAFNPELTRLAIEAGAHFCDLGGNNDVVAKQFAQDDAAKAADVVVIPDCGLAPGMVAILVADGIAKLDKTDSVKIRVGGLPQNPKPPLNYQMVFSAEGLINEYWEPVEILDNGRPKTVDPMSAIESLSFDGLGEFEAFYTSGGTSTLPKTYENQARFLDYKTIRYPGHCELFRPMLEIGLASREKLAVGGKSVEPRAVFREVLDKNLTFDEPDLVLVRVDVEGEQGGQSKNIRYEIVDRQNETTGHTAMMRMTGYPIAIVAWMAASGKISKRGVVPQEKCIDSALFMSELEKRGVEIKIEEG